jgi:hypothetical protein
MSVLCTRYLFRGDLLLLAIMSSAVSSPLFIGSAQETEIYVLTEKPLKLHRVYSANISNKPENCLAYLESL